LTRSDPAYHTRLRRLNAPAFRNDNIRAAGNVLMHEMNALVARLRRDCADGGYVNIIQLFPQLTLDMFAHPPLFDPLYMLNHSYSALVSLSWVYVSTKLQLGRNPYSQR